MKARRKSRTRNGIQSDMAKTISMTLPHELGEEEVKRRMLAGIADARAKYPGYLKNAHETWNGNTMEFTGSAMGQTVTGRVQIEPKQVHIHVDLPMLLAMLAGRILPRIESEGKKLLSGPKQ
jgi:hypothetical protein